MELVKEKNTEEIDAAAPEAPYPGLRPFSREESSIFFGRRQHWQAILQRLSKGHFVPVLGPSGSGKSSLVRAGVIPSLKAGRLYSAGSSWQVALMRPDTAPMLNMARALANLVNELENEDEGPNNCSPNEILNLLSADPEFGLPDFREFALEKGLGEFDNVLLVIDQFEELFSADNKGLESEIDYIIELIRLASERLTPNFYCIMTMRTDNLKDCARFPVLSKAINESFYLTHSLTSSEIRLAIEQPLKLQRFKGDFDEGLVDRICRDMAEEGDDQLPLMQHILRRMWVAANRNKKKGKLPRLTHDLYKSFGGIADAIDKNANELKDGLSEEQQELLPGLFRSIIEPRGVGSANTVRRLRNFGQIASVLGMDTETEKANLIAIIDKYRNDDALFLWPRFSSTKKINDDTRINLVHECIIRKWGQYSDWIYKESDAIRRLKELVSDSTEKDAHGNKVPIGRSSIHIFSEWIKQNTINEVWAAQYGVQSDTLAAAKRFLQFSKKQLEDEDKKKQDQEVQSRMQWYFFGGISIFALLAIITTGLIINKRSNEAIIEADKQKIEAQELLIANVIAVASRLESVVKEYVTIVNTIEEKYNTSSQKAGDFDHSYERINKLGELDKELDNSFLQMNLRRQETFRNLDHVFKKNPDYELNQVFLKKISDNTKSIVENISKLKNKIHIDIQKEIMKIGGENKIYGKNSNNNPYLMHIDTFDSGNTAAMFIKGYGGEIIAFGNGKSVTHHYLDLVNISRKSPLMNSIAYDQDVREFSSDESSDISIKALPIGQGNIWKPIEIAPTDDDVTKIVRLKNQSGGEVLEMEISDVTVNEIDLDASFSISENRLNAAMFPSEPNAGTSGSKKDRGEIVIFPIYLPPKSNDQTASEQKMFLGNPVAKVKSKHTINHAQFLNNERFLAVVTEDEGAWIAAWQTKDLLAEAARRQFSAR